jgi:hypothetical protein
LNQIFITAVYIGAFIFDLLPKIRQKERKAAIITALLLISGYVLIMLDVFDLPVTKPLQEFRNWVSTLL